MSGPTDSPPRAPPIKYTAHLGTRWQKEKAAAGHGAFEFPEDPRYIGQWIIGECVGKGASGRVRIAKHRRTGELAAVKILPLQPIMNSRASLATQQAKSEKQRLGIDREIIMMKLMNHPNILRIYDVFEGDKELYLVLEYVEGGELFDFLVNRGRLPPLEALAYFKQIVYGLNYAHTFSIIHRDLKPENILIHSLHPPLIKIADWGMAAFAPPALQLETSCGSPHYASPEIVNGWKYKGNATDIWSCGVILYALLSGRLPFDDKNVRTLLSKVKAGKYDMPAYIDPQAKDLLSRMLVVDVNRRITISEIIAHPWFNKNTPGILYVPAPSVTELARPLASAAHIDQDLLESLRVIWGRHGDVEIIKNDLLSPAGEGTLAKAFYFLLHQYREQTLKDNGIIFDTDHNPTDKIITKQYSAPPPQKPKALQDETGARTLRLRSSRDAPPPPSRTPSPNRRRISPLPTASNGNRARPPSPIGPRPHRNRPIHSPSPPEALARHKSMHAGQVIRAPLGVHTEPSYRARASTASMLSPRVGSEQPASYLGPTQQMFQPMHAPATPPIGSQNRFPFSPARNSAQPVLSPGLARAPFPAAHVSPQRELTPRSGIENARKTVDTITERVNVLVARENAAQAHNTQVLQDRVDKFSALEPSTYNQGYYRSDAGAIPDEIHRHERNHENKENRGATLSRSLADARDFMHAPGGLGLSRAKTTKAGREPYTNYNESDSSRVEGMKGKEKSARPPALDMHPPVLSPRRSTLGSPMQLMSPVMPSIISSPVGEFKGWFSNLFNWKAHTYVLCSTDDISATRNEAIRILEQLGVAVALEEIDGHGLLKCRMNDLIDANSNSVIQKQVRFKVEFSTSSNSNSISSSFSPSPQMGSSTPRLPHQTPTPMSPTLSSFTRHSMGKQVQLAPGSGYTCAMVLMQEKGSVATFRSLCRWLREEWTLDALRSPVIGAGGPGVFVEAMSPQRLVV
ncbi:kinase-like domain-containing protein [Hygrophoropsis aurantiaca]|uniref:Kinase-like domain-containing protein n=1 Tax=Hygrophoropsis aurantiaca TaxID=72124 RepID=A0ACB8A0N6_9AGAM|nr:kinase-like domain-containing protein [Hygrophoropsis aurantiaca]